MATENTNLLNWILAGCLDGYKLFTGSLKDCDNNDKRHAVDSQEDSRDESSSDRDLNGTEFQVLLWNLKIEEVRLDMWGRVCRFITTDRETNDSAGGGHDEVWKSGDDGTALETLLKISDLLKDYEELQERYGLELVAERMELLGISNPAVTRQLILRKFEKYHGQDMQTSRKKGQEKNFLQKFRWVVRDGMKVKEAVSRLREYNDALYRLLSIAERRTAHHGMPAVVVTSDDLAGLTRLQLACSKYRNISEIVSLRRRKLEIDSMASITAESPGILPDEMRIDSAKITPLSVSSSKPSRGSNRFIASYADSSDGTSSHRVLVEWKYFTNEETEGRQKIELSRLTNLARLLHEPAKPAGLCVPRCLGYISDEWNSRVHSRVGYVFQWSKGSVEARSLHDLLSASTERVPHLGERFNLALQLSKAVSIFHLAGWVHRAIRSHNIVFLGNEGKAARERERERDAARLDNLHILGFDYSHSEQHGGATSSGSSIAKPNSVEYDFNLYRHQEVQGHPHDEFSAISDIYALGVVLLEIGLWKRISDFWQSSHTMETFHRDLLKVHVPRLGAKVGNMYMDVTALCLGGECGAGGGAVELHQQFYWDVVKKLSELVV